MGGLLERSGRGIRGGAGGGLRRGHGGGLLGGSKTSFACSVSGEDVGRWALRGCAVGSWRLEVGPGLVKRESATRSSSRREEGWTHVPCPAYLDRVVVGSSAGVDFFPDLIQGRDVIGHARDTQAAVFTRCVLQIENTPIFGCRCMPPHQTDTSLHHALSSRVQGPIQFWEGF